MRLARPGATRTPVANTDWHSGGMRPSEQDPLLILAMDHRESFGKSLFGVVDDAPTPAQRSAMQRAKLLTYQGLRQAAADLPGGRPAVLVDERYGQAVIEAARRDGITLAVPVERSGRQEFQREYGADWLVHVQGSGAAYAKVLVRDNPGFDAALRRRQLDALREVSQGLAAAGIPMLYELLVPPLPKQKTEAYDGEVRPALVTQVIADNQDAGVEPALWKVEGLESADAARAVVAQARTGGREHVGLVVLGRDAPVERLTHWLQVAAPVEGFVGFAIGRSIWEDALAAHTDDKETVEAISREYLRYARTYLDARVSD